MTVAVSILLNYGVRQLHAAGIDTAALDARLLLQQVLECTHEALVLHSGMVRSDQAERYGALIARRAAREPLSHLLGYREFYGRNFIVTRDVLTPRPDSETLIEAALRECGVWSVECGRSNHYHTLHSTLHILDLGTGSGCLLLTLLCELKNAYGIGVDRSAAALRVARENAKALGVLQEKRVDFLQGNWANALQGPFELIISNPPYIKDSERLSLMPEVRDHEPAMALFAGEDGLDCYRQIAHECHSLLAPGGLILLEAGAGQSREVAALLEAAGLTIVGIYADLAGVPRCVAARNA